MITLSWTYILIGWVVFFAITFIAEKSIGSIETGIHYLIVWIFIALPAIVLFVATVLAIFLGIAQLFQPYITVIW